MSKHWTFLLGKVYTSMMWTKTWIFIYFGVFHIYSLSALPILEVLHNNWPTICGFHKMLHSINCTGLSVNLFNQQVHYDPGKQGTNWQSPPPISDAIQCRCLVFQQCLRRLVFQYCRSRLTFTEMRWWTDRWLWQDISILWPEAIKIILYYSLVVFYLKNLDYKWVSYKMIKILKSIKICKPYICSVYIALFIHLRKDYMYKSIF